MMVVNEHLNLSVQHIRALCGNTHHTFVNYEENDLTRVRTVNHTETSFDKSKLPLVRKALVNAFGDCEYQAGLKERSLKSTAIYKNGVKGFKMTVRLRVYRDICTISFSA